MLAGGTAAGPPVIAPSLRWQRLRFGDVAASFADGLAAVYRTDGRGSRRDSRADPLLVAAFWPRDGHCAWSPSLPYWRYCSACYRGSKAADDQRRCTCDVQRHWLTQLVRC